jgi:two-component sensor histidine kinase
LGVVRLEQEGNRPGFRRVDLRDVVAQAVEAARTLLTPAHRLTVHSEPRPVPVMGDPGPLGGIVASLVDNAIRYSPAGGPVHVSVGIERSAAVCRVIDRGVGIAERDLPRLFTPFGRIGANGAAGDGLALHLGRELALLHGGDIAVDSTPGLGTSFGLVLPLAGADPVTRYDVEAFGLGDMVACGAALRAAGAWAFSFDDAARRVVRHLRESLRFGPGEERACALVRLFRGRPAAVDPATLALTLVATAGEREEWNDPARSAGHRVIPLPPGGWWPPMVARLLEETGLRPDRVRDTSLAERTCNVFHVPDAGGSPYVPAQEEFVGPFGIRSVLGFGGLLAPSDLYVVVLFSKGRIARAGATLFRPVSHSAKLALRRFALS